MLPSETTSYKPKPVKRTPGGGVVLDWFALPAGANILPSEKSVRGQTGLADGVTRIDAPAKFRESVPRIRAHLPLNYQCPDFSPDAASRRCTIRNCADPCDCAHAASARFSHSVVTAEARAPRNSNHTMLGTSDDACPFLLLPVELPQNPRGHRPPGTPFAGTRT